MALARLILYPQHGIDVLEDMTPVIEAMRDVGFISTQYRDGQFLAGNEFLSLLSFLGCSPEIHLHPDDGENFCHLIIGPVSETAQCLGYTATVKPRCPSCKQKLAHWQQLENWQLAETLYRCEHCDSAHRMDALKWRHEGGYGRCSLVIVHIHPHEAVPSEQLLQLLKTASGFDWNYCYATD